MRVAILHLSDLHIDSDNHQWLKNKTENIVSAVLNDFCDSDKIIIVVSGDIANTGKEEQYGYAKIFFKALLRVFAEKNLGKIAIENKIICVPGNHDCNFEKESVVRKLLLDSLRAKTSCLIDKSVYDTISEVQNEYKSFAGYIMLEEGYSLLINNDIPVKVGEKTILFRLYNTAWMSILKENQNSILMPVCLLAQESYNADLAISIFHHHYSWLSSGYDNNKNRFRNHIMQTSNMVLYGHEHTPSSSKIIDHYEGEIVNEFEGGSLYSNHKGIRESSFNSFVIDLESFVCIARTFEYDEGLYFKKKEEHIDLNKERKTDEFRHNEKFLELLKKMSIPIHNSENIKMTLDEFFVFPDLERLNTKQLKVDEDFIDSASILDDKLYNLVMLEGDDQSGKTSLLSMYYLKFVGKYMYPILIKGKNITNENIDKIISTAFTEQYICDKNEKYSQHKKEQKILMVDNFDECALNDAEKKKIIEKLTERFQKVIITTRENGTLASLYYLMSSKDTLLARIKPLGHVKRNELVRKFYSTYNVNAPLLHNQAFLEQVKAGFDMVENFLGKEYIPSYPIYILSILLSNSKIQGNPLDKTSYGYCYESLITCALLTCVDAKTKIDKYYNVLMNLAYYIFKKNNSFISEQEFADFYCEYQEIYHADGYKETKNNLLKCNLLKSVDDYYYKFSYNYIYYFLVAKYMAGNIHSKEGVNDILELCVNIHDEKKANILIFIAHHVKNPQFIEATQLALTSALETQVPVTLNRDDNYYILLNELCESLKREIITPETNIDPEKEREKMLKKLDDREKYISKGKINPNDLPIEIQNMNKSLRSIEVVGQIVKNRHGSLAKTDIKAMVIQLYNTAFRTISYFGSIIEADRAQMIDDIVKNKKAGVSSNEIQKKLDTFFEVTSLNFCLFVFSKIINSVGNKELRATFTHVADEMGTPAAKLVSFSIISCFSKIAITELRSLVEELKDNPVAMSIIRARVRSYLYNNHVNFADRQRIIQAVNLSPKDSNITTNQFTRRYK